MESCITVPTKYVRKSKWKLGCQTNFHSFTHVLNPTGLGLNKAFMIILQRLMLILKFSRFQQYWNHQLTRWWPGPIMVQLWELWWLIMREMKTPTSTKDKSSYSIHVFGMSTRRQSVQSPRVRQYWHYVCVITSIAMISTKQNAINVSIFNIMVMKSTE